MKMIIIISLIFSSCSMVKNMDEYILIEHIGISDKPIPTLIISKRVINLEGAILNYLLKGEAYNIFNNSITSLCKRCDEKELKEFGSFKLTHYKEGKELLGCKISRENANLLFPQLISTINNAKGNKDLVIEMQSIYKRIKL